MERNRTSKINRLMLVIEFQGNKIRQLKVEKPPNKELIGQEVAILKDLKAALEKMLAEAPPPTSGDTKIISQPTTPVASAPKEKPKEAPSAKVSAPPSKTPKETCAKTFAPCCVKSRPSQQKPFERAVVTVVPVSPPVAKTTPPEPKTPEGASQRTSTCASVSSSGGSFSTGGGGGSKGGKRKRGKKK